MARVLLAIACLGLLGCVGVWGGTLKVSQERAMENMQWLGNTMAKMQADPEFAEANKQELLNQITQIAFNFDLNMRPVNTSSGDADPICFRDIQVKFGQPPDLCINETYPSIDHGRCYPDCRTGFKGFANICRQTCKAGWTYHGLTDLCVEIPVVGPNTTGCPWYDSCGHLAAHGCARCPAGYPKEDWLLCECHLNHTQNKYKPATYDRSHGVAAVCKAPRFFHNGQCFFNCTSDYTTHGGLCLEKCPATYQEIALICCQTFSTCVDKLSKIATDGLSILTAIMAIVSSKGSFDTIKDLIQDIINTIMDVLIPNCKAMPPVPPVPSISPAFN